MRKAHAEAANFEQETETIFAQRKRRLQELRADAQIAGAKLHDAKNAATQYRQARMAAGNLPGVDVVSDRAFVIDGDEPQQLKVELETRVKSAADPMVGPDRRAEMATTIEKVRARYNAAKALHDAALASGERVVVIRGGTLTAIAERLVRENTFVRSSISSLNSSPR